MDDRLARLHIMVAAEARTAAVLRRAVGGSVQMLHWDLVTDEVTPGQWLSGRVYAERCGISPDGRLLVYFAGKFARRHVKTYTALCRPPSFTALALWPTLGTREGGGYFEDDRTLVLDHRYPLHELDGGQRIPADFTVTRVDRPQHAPRGDRWVAPVDDHDPIMTWHKTSPTRPNLRLERQTDQTGALSAFGHRIVEVERSGGVRVLEELPHVDCAELDHNGDLLLGADDGLFRRVLSASRNANPVTTTNPVADLSGYRHQRRIAPPDARVWP